MKIPITRRLLKTTGKTLSVAVMLLLYVTGSIQTGYLHQLLHPGEIALNHSPKLEQDPCHRSMYHGLDTGCRHEFHLEKKHSCTFVHAVTHSDPVLFDTCHGEAFLASPPRVLASDSLKAILVKYTVLTRGPPAELHV